MPVTEINFLSKGHSTQGSDIPFMSNLKKPACASKRDLKELATLRYINLIFNVSLLELNGLNPEWFSLASFGKVHIF